MTAEVPRARTRLERGLPSWLRRPSPSTRYLTYCRLWAGASAIHLTLPDAWQRSWAVPDLLYWAGAALLALNGCALGWALSAVGLLVPLLLLGDQLTQSIYLLACSVSALACYAGSVEGRARRLAHSLPAAIRVLTVGVYTIAAVHKLNDGFLDPAVSCATGGLSILADNWGVPAVAAAWPDAPWPHVFLLVEVGLALLLVFRPAAGMVLGLLMHIPLTIVFAPSFAFTMISGWACLLTEAEIRHLGRVLLHRLAWITVIGGALGLASFAAYMQTHWIVYPGWQLKEVSLWMALVWLLFAWRDRGRAAPPPGSPALFGVWSAWREGSGDRRSFVVVLGVVWALNGLLPYTGLSFHHSGAMLSNLRIDEGCWNSLIFPEALRLRDPYVRIDEAEVGDVRGREALVGAITGKLWNPRSLRRARRGWCASGAGPIRVQGTYAGSRFESSDLCRVLPLPDPPLPAARLFQENLDRVCPQQCIH